MANSNTRFTYLFFLPWSLDHVGGVNQVVINLAQQIIQSAAYDPIVLIQDWDAIQPVWGNVNGIRTVRWRIYPFNCDGSIKEKISFKFWEKIFLKKFDEFCENYRVSVINFHYPGPTVFTIDRIVKKLKRNIPIIVSFHGADLSTIQKSSLRTRKEWKRLLPQMDEVVVCSNNLGVRLREIVDSNLAPTVIHNGLDASSFRASTSLSAKSQHRKILNVAKFEQKKGQDILIEAFASLANDYPDLTLVLVGATSESLTSLKGLTAHKNLEGKVLFYPDIPHVNIAQFFNDAEVFVLPSREEPFGIVLLEAGAFSLPVVASNVGGIPEIITTDHTGYLVPPDDVPELASALRKVLDNPTVSQQLGANLRVHVEDNFSWTAAYKKYITVVQNHGTTRHCNTTP